MDDSKSGRKRQFSEDNQAAALEQKRERLGSRTQSQQSLSSRTCAKWCHISGDDRAQIDESRVRILIWEAGRDGWGTIADIISGKRVSGQVHPLIFEAATDDDDESIRLRSLSFYEELLVDVGKGRETYLSLSNDMKRIVGVGVRDLYLAAWRRLADDREKRILDGMVQVINGSAESTRIGGMDVSFCPSGGFRVLKFIENLDQQVAAELTPFFAQISESPRLFVAFVDPIELSYHNFENIVPLDRWIEGRSKEELEFSLTVPQRLKSDREVFAFEIHGRMNGLMKELASLDLYTSPLNKGTRGGERFIFHSALLSQALSEAVRGSGILDNISDGAFASSFEFVNYVFRCNRFCPGDDRFTSHLDTPYYDSSRSHISKYTILIYLTSGSGRPALRVGDIKLLDVQEMTCVIFDQRLEHEGQPFVDNEKVFIRSELIFKDETLEHDDRAASLFSTACYLTGESVFNEELAKYAHSCFERASSLHWAVEQESTEPPLYLRKAFRGLEFVTNGYDYWFKRSPAIKPADCAMIAALDYFNCKIRGRPFRSLCKATPIRRRFAKTEDIWSVMVDCQSAEPALKRLSKYDIEPLIQKRAKTPFSKRESLDDFESDSDEENERNPCCPFHCYRTFNAWNDEAVQQDYEKCWKYTWRQLFNTPLVILGEELCINESHIKVEGDKIFFLRPSDCSSIPPLNFAACWADLLPSTVIQKGGEICAPGILIPPILFRECKEGYHLVLDLFKNDWMVRVDDTKKVSLPVISNDLMAGEEDGFPTFWKQIGFGSDDEPDMSDDTQSWVDWSVDRGSEEEGLQ